MSNFDNTVLVRLEEVSKHYQMGGPVVIALERVSLAIDQGNFVAVTGPSGSGKSTLLHILACLDYPSQGRYFFKGTEIQNLDSNQLAAMRSREVGIVFQEFRLIPRFSVFKNVELPLIYQGYRARHRYEMVKLSLAKVDLTHRIGHRPSELSGGEKQRVAIARALVANPSLLLADEPTGNLDSKFTEEIFVQLQALNREGTTIVMVTHDESLARRCEKIYRIKDGRIDVCDDDMEL
jgi:putative ABC transport system ATP-binding protein